ncbi:MAG TPA: heme o synthase [Verrucomicrobiae bacterium]|nr:heme o synthase [Verrucomicrobiae bacterium]
MKASVQTIADAALAEKSGFAVFSELVKARLTALVLITTLVGFYAGSGAQMDYWKLLHAMLGTALVACGASALNQLLEREQDAKMRRTESRPLPSGRMDSDTVLLLGAGLAAGGLLYLALAVNLLTSFLGALTLASYLFVYTPLKRITTLNTFIGAIPGAIPPLMGWTAATGHVSAAGWSLFAILFLWQLPHFMAIAWLYREDYARGGFKMLPIIDPDGSKTAAQAICHSFGLIPVSLFPALLGVAGVVYFGGAILLSLTFLFFAIQFSRKLTAERARHLFIASIIYLPLLLGLLVLDKVK